MNFHMCLKQLHLNVLSLLHGQKTNYNKMKIQLCGFGPMIVLLL
jgi:hypothetical protein